MTKKSGLKKGRLEKGKKGLLIFVALLAGISAVSFFYIYSGGKRPAFFSEKPCIPGNKWATIDEFQYAEGSQSSPDAMMSDKEGNIFLAGIAWEGSKRYWIVRKSGTGGWETSDIYMSESSALGAMAFGMGQDSLGNYYAAGVDGIAMEAKPHYRNHWIVRMSPDGKPGSWETVDDFLFRDKAGALARGIAADSSGNIYAAGEGYQKFGNSFWIVRKGSTYDKNSWKTVDEFQFEGASSSPTQIAVDPFSNIFVIGSGNKKWLVRKSEDRGESWTTLDSYQYMAGKSSYPSDIGFSQSGQIYVAGQGLDEKDSKHWIVRKSEDFGLTWKTVDDYQFEAGRHSYATGIAIDGSGGVYAGGSGQTSSFNNPWIVRSSSDGGKTWEVSDTYRYNLNNPDDDVVDDTVEAMGLDSRGMPVAAGHVYGKGSRIWIVRGFPCP